MNTPIKHETNYGVITWRLPNGLLHREDGPAITMPYGYQKWYQNGQLHRTDGPAVIFSDGYTEYRLVGIEYDPVTFLIKSYEYDSQT